MVIEIHVHQLDDPAETETLDRMFGEGEWVVCIGCPKAPLMPDTGQIQWGVYHHRKMNCGNQS